MVNSNRLPFLAILMASCLASCNSEVPTGRKAAGSLPASGADATGSAFDFGLNASVLGAPSCPNTQLKVALKPTWGKSDDTKMEAFDDYAGRTLSVPNILAGYYNLAATLSNSDGIVFFGQTNVTIKTAAERKTAAVNFDVSPQGETSLGVNTGSNTGASLNIFGGQDPDAAVLGMTVGLRYPTTSLCSAAVICAPDGSFNPKDFWVLSAGHCDFPSGIAIGRNAYNPDQKCYLRDSPIKHPQYSGWNGSAETTAPRHDLELMHYSCDPASVTMLKCAQISRDEVAPNTPLIVAGFGRKGSAHNPGTLFQTQSNVVALSASNSNGFWQRAVGSPTDGRIASTTSGSSGICSGDSGGPSYVVRNGQYFLAGIHSAGSCDDQQGMKVIDDISVAAHYDWIVQTARVGGGGSMGNGGAVNNSPVPQAQPQNPVVPQQDPIVQPQNPVVPQQNSITQPQYAAPLSQNPVIPNPAVPQPSAQTAQNPMNPAVAANAAANQSSSATVPYIFCNKTALRTCLLSQLQGGKSAGSCIASPAFCSTVPACTKIQYPAAQLLDCAQKATNANSVEQCLNYK